MRDVCRRTCLGRPWSCQKLFTRSRGSVTRRPSAVPPPRLRPPPDVARPVRPRSADLFDFLVSERLAPLEARWSLERDGRLVPPDTLKIGIAPWCRRLLPGGGRGGLRGRGALRRSVRRDGDPDERGKRERRDCVASVHVAAPPVYLFLCPVAGSTTPSWPYISSSTNSTHLYSRSFFPGSRRR